MLSLILLIYSGNINAEIGAIAIENWSIRLSIFRTPPLTAQCLRFGRLCKFDSVPPQSFRPIQRLIGGNQKVIQSRSWLSSRESGDSEAGCNHNWPVSQA